ncbi:testis-expressed protein 9-like isoform X2 [Aphis gossypii]|uniref:testis-expressed protein 9-like isoform X2 n=1 Tax=Aphis gossypii TaxID=80765 RepID=UPI0021595B85|nr:testis-expressed protein 9-like isoform X2 [Aphis gossypii]
MAHMPKEHGEISKNEEVLQMKYEENNKITKQFMDEINEMKKFNTFMKIIDNGDTIEEIKTVTSKEITIKNYVLQKEIDRLNNELVKKDDLNDHLQEENKKLIEEKDKYFHQLSLLKEKIRKHEKEIDHLTGTLKIRDSEVNRILKEIGCIERKFKHEQIIHEKQKSIFIKASDENKQLKETVKKLEATHKDIEEKYTKALSKNDDILAKCVREKDVLITGFRKQLELIDSLKKQNVRTKLQEEINILENEFTKLLEGK